MRCNRQELFNTAVQHLSTFGKRLIRSSGGDIKLTEDFLGLPQFLKPSAGIQKRTDSITASFRIFPDSLFTSS
jgi:hypothetical protein